MPNQKSAPVGRRLVPELACSRCGAAMHCGAQAGESACWCQELPTLPQPDLAAGCYCRACLTELLATPKSGNGQEI